jgi:16S rRNA (uracil1498-N3)-methyltransferase
MAHFYLIDDLEGTVVGANISLVGPEGRHAATVSRVRVGENLQIGNGRGLLLEAQAVSVSKDSVTLLVTAVQNVARPDREITLVQALAKNDRDERAIEACTELGIDTIVPWAAERSISRWEGPKVAKGMARWQAIVREATKQSIRPFIPEIAPYGRAAAVLDLLPTCHVIVLDPTGDVSLSDAPLVAPAVASEGGVERQGIALVVGPEGGITDAELALFRSHGAIIATLGTNILRTSTAGPAALAIVGSRLGRL